MNDEVVVLYLVSIVAIGVLLAFLLLIDAILLRAAVALYNKMAGGASSPSSVPEPAIGKAMGIVFVTYLVQVIAGFLIGLVMVAGTAAAQALERGVSLGVGVAAVGMFISYLVRGVLIMAGVLSAMGPASFSWVV
ncbi:MAG: hypothetical protein RML93_11640 [Anaerolineales bacterium]|nr:hypothetical protein [Anaerolineales bacterium]MDW8447927.1 hypothetical protein [Anaerolineales bacterium]